MHEKKSKRIKYKRIKSHKNKKHKGGMYTIGDKCEIHFYASVDPNHMNGSTVKLTNGDPFPTKCNLCSVLVIKMLEEGFESLLNQESRQNGNLTDTESYKEEYLKKFNNSLTYKQNTLTNEEKTEWEKLKDDHLYDGKITELAWKNPNNVQGVEIDLYTAALPSGYTTLEEVDSKRKGRWGYVQRQKSGNPEGIPVIETCGVILIDKDDKILTFPNLKFMSYYSLPGGSVNWSFEFLKDSPDLETQGNYVVSEALRELKEETGIDMGFSDSNKIPELKIVCDKYVMDVRDLPLALEYTQLTINSMAAVREAEAAAEAARQAEELLKQYPRLESSN